MVKRVNIPKKKRPKMVENGKSNNSALQDNLNKMKGEMLVEKTKDVYQLNDKKRNTTVNQQQLRFFNNGVETHMDGSPLGLNKITRNEIGKVQRDALSMKMNGNKEDSSTLDGVKKNAALPPNALNAKKNVVPGNSSGSVLTRFGDSDSFNPISKGKKKIPKSQMEGKRTQYEISENAPVPNSKMSKLFRRSNDAKRNGTPDSSSQVEKKFAAIPNISAPIPEHEPNTSTMNPNNTQSQLHLGPSNKTLKKKPQQFMQSNPVVKKRKINKSMNDPMKDFEPASASSIAPVKPIEQTQSDNFDPDKSMLSENCTRDEFFAFVIERVPELAPSVAIIKGRFEEDEENVVPLQAVNLILAELLYLANMDRSNSSSRKKGSKALPLFREKPSLRIFKCIKQIEKYKSSLVESLRPGSKVKKISESNPTRLPVQSTTKPSDKSDNGNNIMKIYKKEIPKSTSPPILAKAVTMKNGNLGPFNQEGESIKKKFIGNVKGENSQKPGSSPQVEKKTAKLSGVAAKALDSPKAESGEESKKKEKSEEALNAARALLNFGVK